MDGWSAEPALKCAVDGWVAVGAVAVLGLERRVVPRDDLRVGIFRSSVGVALGECARCARIGAGADEVGSEMSRGFHAGLVEPFFLPVGSEERLLPAYRVEGGGESSAPTMKKRPRGERGTSAGGGPRGVLTTNPRAPGLRTWREKISASPIRRLERAQTSPRRRSSGERVQKNGSSENAVWQRRTAHHKKL